MQDTTERIRPTRIEDEMRDSYLDYAMSVIVSRALPDVRDGLKPVQRRVVFGMQELGVGPGSAFKKTARIVGEVMGKFHPHGDAPIYDTLVRLAQPFTLRYPLVAGQGNFGSIDGDPPAQMRYTEARLAPIATELLADLDRETVDFQPNFDDSVNEPAVLPARLPNLLLNGSTGIAVGMATSVPPHHLGEICEALILLIDRPEATVDELMEHVRGPDFPTRGRIFGREAIREAYRTGRGKITMRGVIHPEETANGRLQLVVDELPYQVNKATLIQRIADLVRARRIEGVSDLRDESDRDGMRIVIELARNGQPATVENQLFRLTALQSTFAVNMLALVGGRPVTVSLREALQAFVDHRREVIRRRSEFDLARARERAHVLEGLLRALELLDEVIAAIRASESADAARTALQEAPFALSERQAQAVLDMQLRRLAALERQRIIDEHAQLAERIAELEDLLAHPEKIDALIQEDCRELMAEYGDERRTRVFEPPVEDISDEDLVPHQQIVVTISDRGYMKRVPLETYRVQGRGGRGVTGAPTREEDAVNHLVACDTHDSLLLFTQRGRVYSLKGYEAPEGKRQARGVPVVNLIDIEEGDRVTAMVVVTDFSRDSMVVATARGEVKRTPLEQFESVRRPGLIAMNLKEGDRLVAARAAEDDDTAMLVSSGGRAIRFRVGTLRVASRSSGGVRGMRLPGGEEAIGLVVDRDGEDLLVVSELGMGKRTPFAEYAVKGRGGLGVLTFRVSGRGGPLAVARAVRPGQQLILVSREGIVMRTRADTISRQGRNTQGVAVMNIEEGDALAAVAQIDLGDDGPRLAPPDAEAPPDEAPAPPGPEAAAAPAPALPPEQTAEAEASAEPEQTAGAEPSAAPEQTAEADPSAAPEQTADAEPSAAPEQTADAEASTAPEQTAGAEAAAAPEQTADAEASAAPEQTADAEPSAAPEQTADAEASAAPEQTAEAEASAAPQPDAPAEAEASAAPQPDAPAEAEASAAPQPDAPAEPEPPQPRRRRRRSAEPAAEVAPALPPDDPEPEPPRPRRQRRAPAAEAAAAAAEAALPPAEDDAATEAPPAEPRAATDDELRAALEAALGEEWTPQAEALAAARRALPRGAAPALRRALHRAVREGWIEERPGEDGAPELRLAAAPPAA